MQRESLTRRESHSKKVYIAEEKAELTLASTIEKLQGEMVDAYLILTQFHIGRKYTIQ